MYKPLPNFLIIKESEIEGKGLFTSEPLKASTQLGISHVWDKEFDDYLIRTPLGGFINHSNTPNCVLIREGRKFFLHTLKDIESGSEITLKYSITNYL